MLSKKQINKNIKTQGKVALDIDGVLADTETTLKEKIIKDLGLNAVFWPQSTNYYSIEETFPGEEKEQVVVRNLIRQYYNYGENTFVYENCRPYSGAVRIAKLLSHYKMFAGYITRRNPQKLKKVTLEWLEKYDFPEIDEFCILDAGQKKSDCMFELGADYIVEDNPREIEEVLSSGKNVVMRRHSYNEHMMDKYNVPWINNIGDISEYIFVNLPQ